MKKTVTSAGGVVLRRREGTIEVLIVERHTNVEPKWAPVLRQLPKGGVEKDEAILEAALREVLEETGYTGTVVGKAGEARWSYWRNGIEWHETVHYFLMKTSSESAAGHDDEFDAVRWVSIEDAMTILSYPEERAVISQVAGTLDRTYMSPGSPQI